MKLKSHWLVNTSNPIGYPKTIQTHGTTEAAYRLAAAAVKLATGDPEEACAAGMG